MPNRAGVARNLKEWLVGTNELLEFGSIGPNVVKDASKGRLALEALG